MCHKLKVIHYREGKLYEGLKVGSVKTQVPISQLPGRSKRWQMKSLDSLEH